MSIPKRTAKALALLIPTGAIGISAALATTQPQPAADGVNGSVADRLSGHSAGSLRHASEPAAAATTA